MLLLINKQASDETGDIMALIGKPNCCELPDRLSMWADILVTLPLFGAGLLPNLAESQGFPWSSDQQNACAAAFRIFICNLLVLSFGLCDWLLGSSCVLLSLGAELSWRSRLSLATF